MQKFIKYFIATVIILNTSLAIGQDDKLIIPVQGLYIVKAKVVDTKLTNKGSTEAKLVIQHVYLGPSELKGQYFVNYSSDSGSMGGYVVTPSLKIDNEGIWIVEKEKDAIVSTTYYSMGIISPILKRDGILQYEKVLNLAEVIEKTSKIVGYENQVTRVKELILDDSPIISRFAVEALSESVRAADQQYLRDLAGKGKLTVTASIKLDEILIEKDGDSWEKSEDRKKFMAEILKRNDLIPDDRDMISYLYFMTQHDHMETSDFIYLLEVAQANTEILKKMGMTRVITVIHKMIKMYNKDPKKIITILIQDMKSEEKTRSESARKLLMSFSTGLDEKQLEVLRQIRSEADDEDVSRILDEILSNYDHTITE